MARGYTKTFEPFESFESFWLRGRFPEGFHGNPLVTDLEDLQMLRTAGRAKDYLVPWAGLHQRSRQRRSPADMAPIDVHLVDADDAHDALGSGGIGVPHGRPEEHVGRRAAASLSFGVDNFRGIDPLPQKANPPIDLA